MTKLVLQDCHLRVTQLQVNPECSQRYDEFGLRVTTIHVVSLSVPAPAQSRGVSCIHGCDIRGRIQPR